MSKETVDVSLFNLVTMITQELLNSYYIKANAASYTYFS